MANIIQAWGRRVAILGDMFELGENETSMHYELGEYAVGCCDHIICIGHLSSSMAAGATAKIIEDDMSVNIDYFETREAFLEKREELLTSGDTILLKASHGMEFTKLLDVLKED